MKDKAQSEENPLTAVEMQRGVMWRVIADHPILRRPDKGNMTKSEATAYADSLRPLGYENINIVIDGAT